MRITKRIWLVLAMGLALLTRLQGAQARSGLAAYHLHTGAMVTAARHEPVGSLLRVRNPQNGRSVVVRVNDRGPFNGGRILDLSTGAFSQLYGGLGRGTGPVSYSVISRGGSSLASRHSTGRSRRYRSSKRSKRSRSRAYRRSHRRRHR